MGDLSGVIAILAGLWGGRLVYSDWLHRRLPNYLTLPAAFGAVSGAIAFHPAALTGLLWPVLYLLLGLRGGGIGGGDIKLAVSLGLAVAAAQNFYSVFIVIIGASLITLVAGLLCAVFGRPKHVKSRNLPHGPAMIMSTLIVLGMS